MPAVTSAPFGAFTCPRCRAALSPEALAAGNEEPCPGCGVPLRGQLFPAWSTSQQAPVAAADRALDGEAVCFFHSTNRAALPCDACGRFICTVCDLQIGARHLCPVCVGHGIGSEKLPEIIPRRFLWSFATLWLGAIPLVGSIALWPLLPITGLLTIILAAVGWKRPGSLVRGPQHWAAVIGLLLALAQLAAAFGLFSLIRAIQSS